MAVLYVNDDYGRGLHAAFMAGLDSTRFPVVLDLPHVQSSDLAEQASETAEALRSARPELVVWLARGGVLVHYIDAIRSVLPGVPILGADAVGNGIPHPSSERWAGVSYVAFVNMDGSKELRDFAVRLSQDYHAAGTDAAALTYDAVAMVIAGLRSGGPHRRGHAGVLDFPGPCSTAVSGHHRADLVRFHRQGPPLLRSEETRPSGAAVTSSTAMGTKPRHSLRREVRMMLVSALALVVLGLGGLSIATARVWRAMGAATDALAEDQAIGDEIGQAVMRQLVALSSMWSSTGGGLPQSYKDAAADAYTGLQRYLSRPLTARERRQLQRVKEDEEHLEVDAARLGVMVALGKMDDARRSNDAALLSASRLQAHLATVLDMRQVELERLRARQSEALERMYIAVPTLVLLLLLGVAVVESFFQRRIAVPLANSASAADRVAAGDLDVRVPEGRDKEFATLSDAFNRMTEGLRKANSELRERNRDLAEALDQVQAAQNELLHSEKMNALGRMTAGVAHELNNPLTAVLGYAELLSVRLAGDEMLHPPDLQEFVQPVLEEARRSQGLVRSLLRFSRKSARDLEPVRIQDALDVAIELKRFAFQQAGLGLDVGEIPDCWVKAEGQRLQEVFVNLIDNAQDAMKEAASGRLRIEASEDENTLPFSSRTTAPDSSARSWRSSRSTPPSLRAWAPGSALRSSTSSWRNSAAAHVSTTDRRAARW